MHSSIQSLQRSVVALFAAVVVAGVALSAALPIVPVA